MSNVIDWSKYLGTPKQGAAAAVQARRAAVVATGDAKRIAAHDALAARNSEHLWAEVEAADECEVES